MSKLLADLSAVTTVAVDLAKHVFQVHGCDGSGRVVVARALRRREVLPFFASLGPCLVGMEACGSAHHWGRALLALGHDVKLIPPVYVKPFVKRQKNDKMMQQRSMRRCSGLGFALSRCAALRTRQC
jgi:transposase